MYTLSTLLGDHETPKQQGLISNRCRYWEDGEFAKAVREKW